MMNQCIFVGRIVNDPEVQESENGKKHTNVTIAVPRSYKNADGEYETDFINCSLFDGIASNTCEYCHKGDLIGIKGRVESYSYKKEDGTKKYGQNVIAERVTFLSSKSKEINEEIEQRDSEIEM